jgi:hypothetical protein
VEDWVFRILPPHPLVHLVIARSSR